MITGTALADYHCSHWSPNASIVAGYHLECPFFSILANRRCRLSSYTRKRGFPWFRLKKVLLSPLFTLSGLYVDFLPYVEGFTLLTSMAKSVLNRQNFGQARYVMRCGIYSFSYCGFYTNEYQEFLI